MRIEAQTVDRSTARLDWQLRPDPMQDGTGFAGHEGGEIRGVLAPAMEQVLQHLGEEGAARPHRVRQRPLSRLRDGGAGSTHARTGRVEAEAVDAAAPDPAAVRVFTRGRAEDTRDEGRGLHWREQLRGAARRRQEHGAVADKEGAMLTAGIGGIRVDLDRLAGQHGIRVRDLACCRFGVEGERIGGGQASRRSVQPVAGEDVQPDDGLPQHVRRDSQHRVQQQGLYCEKAGAEERRADRHTRIPRRQVLKHGWGQDALIVDPWPEIGIVAR